MRIATSSDGGRSSTLAEVAGQVARQVVERAAGRRHVHEAEQRRAQLRVLRGAAPSPCASSAFTGLRTASSERPRNSERPTRPSSSSTAGVGCGLAVAHSRESHSRGRRDPLVACRPDALPGRDVQRRGAGAAGAPLHEPRPSGVRAGQPAGDRQGSAFCPLFALSGHAAAALPRRVRGRPRGRARATFDGVEGERAADLYRKIFLGYGDDSVAPARRRPRGLRVGLERDDQGAPARAPGGLPRAVHALHRLRRADAGRRLPLLAARGPRPEYEAAMDDLFDTYAATLPRVEAWAEERFPRADGEPEAAHRRSITGQGARPAARPAAGRVALAHGHVRHRPGLRAAADAPARLAAARGARLRPDDPGRAHAGDAELRLARGQSRSAAAAGSTTWRSASRAADRWAARLGLDSERARGGRRARRCGCCRCAAARTTSWRHCCSRPPECPRRRCAPAVRVLPPDERATLLRRAGGRAREPPPPARAVASRRCATASRSWATTGPSGTSSATACSRSSGSRSRRDLGRRRAG